MTVQSERPVELAFEDLLQPEADFSGLIEKEDQDRTCDGHAHKDAFPTICLEAAPTAPADSLLLPVHTQAFGQDGLGLLTVSGVPGLKEKRAQLLPLARRFANLPDEVKAKYESPESFYSFGWSHGKETLQGRPDVAKGSYYANPLHDCPVDDPQLQSAYPSFLLPNVWPSTDLPELEPALKDLGRLIVEVGKVVARQCDRFVKDKCPAYPSGQLERTINTSIMCKARLLHYFPISEASETCSLPTDPSDVSNWCGWHNDHGSLTGLTSAMYLDADGEEVTPPRDDDSGLYIYDRGGRLVKATVPADHIAFQIGETAQIHSGGVLRATPHAVKGSRCVGVSRETFAVFMEPQWDGVMDIPEGTQTFDAQMVVASASLPPGVPPLSARWSRGQLFSQFHDVTLQAYYTAASGNAA